MLFPFELPGEPRLKIQVYENNIVGTNEAIGGESILLKPYIFCIKFRLCKKLLKEGKCETEKVRIFLSNPNFQGKPRVF